MHKWQNEKLEFSIWVIAATDNNIKHLKIIYMYLLLDILKSINVPIYTYVNSQYASEINRWNYYFKINFLHIPAIPM